MALKHLHAALSNCRFLIKERGARVDVQDAHGNLPLHIACYTGCEETGSHPGLLFHPLISTCPLFMQQFYVTSTETLWTFISKIGMQVK
jgi:hypothetical protein